MNISIMDYLYMRIPHGNENKVFLYVATQMNLTNMLNKISQMQKICGIGLFNMKFKK